MGLAGTEWAPGGTPGRGPCGLGAMPLGAVRAQPDPAAPDAARAHLLRAPASCAGRGHHSRKSSPTFYSYEDSRACDASRRRAGGHSRPGCRLASDCTPPHTQAHREGTPMGSQASAAPEPPRVGLACAYWEGGLRPGPLVWQEQLLRGGRAWGTVLPCGAQTGGPDGCEGQGGEAQNGLAGSPCSSALLCPPQGSASDGPLRVPLPEPLSGRVQLPPQGPLQPGPRREGRGQSPGPGVGVGLDSPGEQGCAPVGEAQHPQALGVAEQQLWGSKRRASVNVRKSEKPLAVKAPQAPCSRWGQEGLGSRLAGLPASCGHACPPALPGLGAARGMGPVCEGGTQPAPRGQPGPAPPASHKGQQGGPGGGEAVPTVAHLCAPDPRSRSLVRMKS